MTRVERLRKIEDIRNKIRKRDSITGEELLLLADDYCIDVPDVLRKDTVVHFATHTILSSRCSDRVVLLWCQLYRNCRSEVFKNLRNRDQIIEYAQARLATEYGYLCPSICRIPEMYDNFKDSTWIVRNTDIFQTDNPVSREMLEIMYSIELPPDTIKTEIFLKHYFSKESDCV